MTNRSTGLLVLLAAVLLLMSNSLYVVSETERAVKLRFGRLIDVDIKPGLHVKIPFAEKIRKFDARVFTLDAEPSSFFTSERKRLIVDAYTKWRIVDVDTYYKSTGGDEAVAHNRLSSRVNDGLRNQFGERTLHEVVSGERDVLMENIKIGLNTTVRLSLGIEIVDVRVKRIDLPSEVRGQVFSRMKAEREKEARELRSRGVEAAEKIRADADRQRTILMANAYREAEESRGEGDAEATATYASAFSKDPEFYAFQRSLKAYTESFNSKGDVLLVDPESDFFRYLNSQQGK